MAESKYRQKYTLHPDAYDALEAMAKQSCLSKSDIVSISLLQQEIRETMDNLPQVGRKEDK